MHDGKEARTPTTAQKLPSWVGHGDHPPGRWVVHAKVAQSGQRKGGDVEVLNRKCNPVVDFRP